MYLMEVAVETRFHASLGVRSLIWRSFQEYLDCYDQTEAWRGVLQKPIAIAAELNIV